MSERNGLVSGIIGALLLLGTGATGWWLATRPIRADKPAAPPAPAHVARPAREEQFNAITLTADAERQLALRTAPVRRQRLPGQRLYGGEVVVPAGHAVVIAAPLAGTLRAPEGGLPQPGQAVKKGQVVFTLQPLLGPEGRANLAAAHVEAEGQVKSARTQVEAARIALHRARRLVEEQAGSRRNLDEAQAAFDLAQKALDAASARRDVLSRVLGDVEKGSTATLPLSCPIDGILRNITALSGQAVPSGAAIFEIFDSDRVWLRVPVYVADLPQLRTDADVAVSDLAARPGPLARTAQPVLAPPSASAAQGTADLYYQMDNRRSPLRPGQRVAVHIPLAEEVECLTLPWRAVVFDIHGGAWVYRKMAPHTYARHRVLVRRVVADMAILAGEASAQHRILPAGTEVVTDAAAELFGTEVGFGK